eukprot:gene10600-3118_t
MEQGLQGSLGESNEPLELILDFLLSKRVNKITGDFMELIQDSQGLSIYDFSPVVQKKFLNRALHQTVTQDAEETPFLSGDTVHLERFKIPAILLDSLAFLETLEGLSPYSENGPTLTKRVKQVVKKYKITRENCDSFKKIPNDLIELIQDIFDYHNEIAKEIEEESMLEKMIRRNNKLEQQNAPPKKSTPKKTVTSSKNATPKKTTKKTPKNKNIVHQNGFDDEEEEEEEIPSSGRFLNFNAGAKSANLSKSQFQNVIRSTYQDEIDDLRETNKRLRESVQDPLENALNRIPPKKKKTKQTDYESDSPIEDYSDSEKDIIDDPTYNLSTPKRRSFKNYGTPKSSNKGQRIKGHTKVTWTNDEILHLKEGVKEFLVVGQQSYHIINSIQKEME